MSDMSQRYPIGPFERPASLSRDDRARHIECIEALPAAVRAAVDGLSAAQLDTPYRPQGWTVRQVVHHLADSHVNGYVRVRRALTEDEPAIATYDQVGWARLDDARHMAVAPSLSLLAALHARWGRLARALSEADWQRAVRHPQHGRLTVDGAMALYAWHGRHHTAHITALRDREGW